MVRSIQLLLAMVVLTSCGEKHAADTTTTASVPQSNRAETPAAVLTSNAKDEEALSPQEPARASATPAQTASPQQTAASIAYSYKLGFELPARRIDEVQRAHRAACEALGPAHCQLLNSSRTGGDSDAASASLELRIVPAIVKSFTAQLETSAKGAGGTLLDSSTTGEDLTRQLIDADAALKAKRTLRDRLQNLLEHHEGRLADLLALEKSLSETQQELDTATAELAELQQRVGFSKFDISYRSEHPLGSTARPLAEAVADAGQTISGSLAALLSLSLALVPWLLPIGLIVFVFRRWQVRRRLRATARVSAPPPPL